MIKAYYKFFAANGDVKCEGNMRSDTFNGVLNAVKKEIFRLRMKEKEETHKDPLKNWRDVEIFISRVSKKGEMKSNDK